MIGSDLTGSNLFIYCGNNPVNRVDYDGQAWETVWDAVSLVLSVVDVCANPNDVWAWVGLGLDVVGLVIPFVPALGVATKVDDVVDIVKFVGKLDDAVDAAKAVNKVDNALDTTKAVDRYLVDDKPFLPDSFYSKHAPKHGTPNSSYINYTFNNYTGKYEKSTVYYDFAGRQSIRIDWTNHGYLDHGNPHVHYTTYNAKYRDGITIRWD